MKDLTTLSTNLSKSNINIVPDYCKEGSCTEFDFMESRNRIIETIMYARDNPNVSHCVFKLSALETIDYLSELSEGLPITMKYDVKLDKRYHVLYDRVFDICNCAFKCNVKIMIDAEESWIQPIIDSLARIMMEKFNVEKVVVINTYQAYLKEGISKLNYDIDLALKKKYSLGVKLVRGAYMVKERNRAKRDKYISPILQSYYATNQSFNNALKLCVNHIEMLHLFLGTHNAESIGVLLDMIPIKNNKIFKKNVYISQLYGMGDTITYNLALSGFNVSKYIPYGLISESLPYLLRRAQENKSFQCFVSREYDLLLKERRSRESGV